MARRLLLLSNSTAHGEGYLDWASPELRDFLGDVGRILFVPFAVYDRASYGRLFAERLAAEGLAADVLDEGDRGRAQVASAQAVFVGGGNTFRLLGTLQRSGLLAAIGERALAGMPYLGASAGINIAGPTIRTTNDMPIVEPDSFEALGLVPFQINPHYLDPEPGSTHMGETREQRLGEFLEENDTPVVGLRENAWIRVEGDRARLGGRRGARIFRRGAEPEERPAGADLSDLLAG